MARTSLEALCCALAELELNGKPGDLKQHKRFVLEDLFNRDPYFYREGGSAPDQTSQHISRYWTVDRARRTDDFVSAWIDEGIVCQGGRRQVVARAAAQRQEALESCMRAVCDAEGDCDLVTRVRSVDGGCAALRNRVLPQFEAGLAAERNAYADVVGFVRDIDQLLGAAITMTDELAETFLRRLVAASVFGPGDALALSADTFGTVEPDRDDEDTVRPLSSDRVALIQVLAPGLAQIGAILTFDESVAVFCGRASGVAYYEERLEKLLDTAGDGDRDGLEDARDVIRTKTANVYRIPDDNEYVGNAHAVFYHDGNAWMCLDLDSTNGTTVVSGAAGDQLVVSAPLTLAAGDSVVLGARGRYGTNLDYYKAATLLLSEYVSGD